MLPSTYMYIFCGFNFICTIKMIEIEWQSLFPPKKWSVWLLWNRECAEEYFNLNMKNHFKTHKITLDLLSKGFQRYCKGWVVVCGHWAFPLSQLHEQKWFNRNGWFVAQKWRAKIIFDSNPKRVPNYVLTPGIPLYSLRYL